MAKKIGNLILMIVGIIVAFYFVVLLTAWIAPVIVFILIVLGLITGITYLVKGR